MDWTQTPPHTQKERAPASEAPLGPISSLLSESWVLSELSLQTCKTGPRSPCLEQDGAHAEGPAQGWAEQGLRLCFSFLPVWHGRLGWLRVDRPQARYSQGLHTSCRPQEPGKGSELCPKQEPLISPTFIWISNLEKAGRTQTHHPF